jgi:plastocyanin
MTVRPTLIATLSLFAVACGSQEPSQKPATGSPAVTIAEVSGTVPRNAIVTLLPANGEEPMPDSPAVMDQIAKQFLPNALLARVGQPVEFRNSEDMPHNVSVTRRISGTEVFNVGTEPHQKYVYTFDRVGQYDVKCDIHEGMDATVIVARGSRTTIAEDDGSFSIPNVQPGAYRISVTFAGQTVEQALEVKTAHTDFKLVR